MKQYVSEVQFGFRSGRGKREAIFNLRMFLGRELDKNYNTIVVFIDLENVFDILNWELLFDYMKNVGIDWKDKILI